MTEPQQESETGISAGLNKKLGPFPVWLYLVLAGLVIFLVLYLRRKNSADNTASTTDTQSSSTLPPFINQVYTNTTPPQQSAPGPEGPPNLEKLVDKPSHVISLTAAETLAAIAKKYKLTKTQLIELNPSLANKYENTGHKVPKGTKVRVYNS